MTGRHEPSRTVTSVTDRVHWTTLVMPRDKKLLLALGKSYLQCQVRFIVAYKLSPFNFFVDTPQRVFWVLSLLMLALFLLTSDFFSIEYLSLCKEADPCCSRGAVRVDAS